MPQHCFSHKALWFSLFVFFVLPCRNAAAGWYDVTTYIGRVGTYPIHLSIQKYAQRDGSGLNIYGSYYYDRHMVSIPLYGKLDEKGRLSLCEIHSDAEFDKVIWQGSKIPVDTSACPFRLTLKNRSVTGEWVNGERRHEVELNESAYLDNTDTLRITGEFEVPFWGQTAEHLFIGSYAPAKTGEAHALVKIVNKRSKAVIQVIDPEKHECSFGFVMTPIYMNIMKDASRPEQIRIQCDSPKAEITVDFRLNRSSGKFEPEQYP